jgi:ketosteroid isomerase-like protein
MKRFILSLAGILTFLLGAPPAFGDPVRDAVEAANESFIERFVAGDMRGVSQLYTEDACVIAPGTPRACGREAIAAFWSGSRKNTKGVALDTGSVESAGDLAYEDGTVHLVATDGKESSARYVVVWKRVGGRWLMHRDIWN